MLDDQNDGFAEHRLENWSSYFPTRPKSPLHAVSFKMRYEEHMLNVIGGADAASNPEGAQGTRRTPRRSATRKAMVEAGRRMIATGTMDSATIDDVIKEADVSRGSFYNHFSDTRDLAEFVRTTVREELEGRIAAATEDAHDPAERLIRCLLAAFRYGIENPLNGRVLINIRPRIYQVSPANHQLLVQHLQVGIDQQLFKLHNIDAGVILVLGQTYLGVSRLLDLHSEYREACEVMRGICIVTLRGLGVSPARIKAVVNEGMRSIIEAPSPPTPSFASKA